MENLRQLSTDPLHSAYYVQNLTNQQAVGHSSLLLPQQQQTKSYQMQMQVNKTYITVFLNGKRNNLKIVPFDFNLF